MHALGLELDDHMAREEGLQTVLAAAKREAAQKAEAVALLQRSHAQAREAYEQEAASEARVISQQRAYVIQLQTSSGAHSMSARLRDDPAVESVTGPADSQIRDAELRIGKLLVAVASSVRSHAEELQADRQRVEAELADHDLRLTAQVCIGVLRCAGGAVGKLQQQLGIGK